MSLLICEFFQLEMLGLSGQARYIAYLIAQYFIGFSQFGLEICIFILFIELTSSKYSSYITIFFVDMFALGEMLIVVISFVLRNWHYHNLSIAAYTFLNTILISVFLPESPRFLIETNNYKEASNVLSKISKINGNSDITEEDIIKEMTQSEENKMILSSTSNINMDELKVHAKIDSNVFDYLLNTKKNLGNLLLLAHVWFTMSMIYYGMNYGKNS